MTSTKHTPGPWYVNATTDDNGQALVRQEHIEICTCWHHSVCSIEREMHANARLIAAAPEMLAALKAYAAWADPALHTGLSELKSIREQIRAAIAKAEGR